MKRRTVTSVLVGVGKTRPVLDSRLLKHFAGGKARKTGFVFRPTGLAEKQSRWATSRCEPSRRAKRPLRWARTSHACARHGRPALAMPAARTNAWRADESACRGDVRMCVWVDYPPSETATALREFAAGACAVDALPCRQTATPSSRPIPSGDRASTTTHRGGTLSCSPIRRTLSAGRLPKTSTKTCPTRAAGNRDAGPVVPSIPKKAAFHPRLPRRPKAALLCLCVLSGR